MYAYIMYIQTYILYVCLHHFLSFLEIMSVCSSIPFFHGIPLNMRSWVIEALEFCCNSNVCLEYNVCHSYHYDQNGNHNLNKTRHIAVGDMSTMLWLEKAVTSLAEVSWHVYSWLIYPRCVQLYFLSSHCCRKIY